MSRGKRLMLLLLAFAASVFGAREAHACSCVRMPTVLDAYEGSEVVVVVRVVSLEKSETEKPARYDGVVSAKVTVEKVYKGNLKAGDELTFAASYGGGDCVWTFGGGSVGQRFLFYVSPPKNSAVWIASICGRSNSLNDAADDLLYLEKLDKVRGRTRLSGTLSFSAEDAPSVAGRKIRIVGAGKTHVVKTDENGVYEIYDLPAGKYLVEPEVPQGWKFKSYRAGDSPLLRLKPLGADGAEEKSPEVIHVVLEDKKHAGLDFRFEVDNAIRGKVFDPSGRPMKDVCLNVVPADGKPTKYFDDSDCTDESGAFEIGEIPPGGYVIVVNDDGKPSSDEPFGTFYYPNVFKREEATVFQIGRGDFLENIHIYAPKVVETITVEGVLLYSDGKPAARKWVEFEPEKDSSDNDESEVRAPTDAKGRFSLKILKGKRGQLFGTLYTYVGEFEDCPKLESLVRQSGQNSLDVHTPAVAIRAEENLYGVELRYPFPYCKEAR